MPEGTEQQPPVEDKSKTPPPPPAEGDLTTEELASAKSLYKALKDPETANELVETLARRAGLLDKKGDTKENREETKKELGRITKKLKTSLGKDYDKFSDAVGPLLDEAVAEYLDEKFTQTESRRSGDKWGDEVNKFIETHELTTKIEDKMKELMDDAPPNMKRDGFNAQKYLKRMYNAALSELGERAPEPKDKRQERKGPTDFEDRIIDKAPSLDDAIEAAMQGIRLKRK